MTKLQGQPTPVLALRETSIEVAAPPGVAPADAPFFLVDHNGDSKEPYLIGRRDSAFRLAVSSSGQRGFTAALAVLDGDAATREVTSRISWRPDREAGEVIWLDRWDDRGTLLKIADREDVERDGPGVRGEDRMAATVTVEPMVSLQCAGVIWTQAGPFVSADELKELDEAARLFPGREPMRGASSEEVRAFIRRTRALVRSADQTTTLFGARAAETARESIAPVVGAAVSSISRGGLVHGANAEPARAEPKPVALERGAPRRFRFRFLSIGDARRMAELRGETVT